jgi:predicted GNAT family N-acyltransferase
VTVPAWIYRIEPLGPDHDRSSFHCGVPELDKYLHQQARQDARRRITAPFVLTATTAVVIGYYTLSAYSVKLTELPDALAGKLPRYPLLPATLLGRLAVDESCRGRHLGRFLLMDALHRSWKSTSEVASIGVVAEAPGAKARAFYLHYEFRPLADHPDKLFLAMATIEQVFGR